MPPQYKHHVFICQNQRPEGHPRSCCLFKGSDKILDYIKERVKDLKLKDVRINKSGCLDQCEKGPVVVTYPEGVWYTIKSIEDAELFIQSHLVQGHIPTSLLLK